MLNSNMLLCLYTRILEDTSFVNGVSEKDMKQAIARMHEDYRGTQDSLDKSLIGLTDFNEVAYRCAYLFKYAPFHTALAFKAMSHALTENPCELRAVLDSLSGPLKLCSLGGGSGADMIGVLAAMHAQFGFFRCSAKLVDIMAEWELTFRSVIDELRRLNYGPLSESVSENWFDWSFMTADLQSEMSKELEEVLGAADIVTMVKFVSAAASKRTSAMIEKVFNMMKPGAFVLFIDNAGGGFNKLISSAATKCKFTAISTPLAHQPYTNECFKNIKYGYRSCYETKVAVQLLMKSGPTNYLKEGKSTANLSCNDNFPSSPASHWDKIYVPRFQNFRIGPKPVNNFAHETFESQPPLIRRPSNFSPLSEFSPRLNRLQAQTDSPNNFDEFQPFCSSSPYVSASQSWSGIDNNEIYDACYANESFGHDLSCYSTEIDANNFASTPFPNRSKKSVGQMYNSAHDSGFSDGSFECQVSWDSPVRNSSPHFRASRRLVRFRNPMRKTSHSFQDKEAFLNTPRNNSKHVPYDENFSAPIPYRQNLQQPEQSPGMYFNGMYNQNHLNFESPWNSNRHPFGNFQHSGPKRDLLSLPPSDKHTRGYKAPRRPRKVFMHQKPYEKKVPNKIMKQLFKKKQKIWIKVKN